MGVYLVPILSDMGYKVDVVSPTSENHKIER